VIGIGAVDFCRTLEIIAVEQWFDDAMRAFAGDSGMKLK
jgi:hypothetical protein